MIKKNEVANILMDMYMQIEVLNYLDILLYIFTLLFLKVTFDGLHAKKRVYEERYIENPDKIDRLMKAQPIIMEKEWKKIYKMAENPSFGYNLNEYLRTIRKYKSMFRKSI